MNVKRGILLLGLVVLTVPPTRPAKTDFTGVWVLDRTKSEGLPPDMEQTVTVTQKGDMISIETKIVSKEDMQTIRDTFLIDGKNKEFEPSGPNGTKGRGMRTIKWRDEGKALEIEEETSFHTPQGPATGHITRKWSLSQNGTVLTIESSFKGPKGETRAKRTFVRKQTEK